jgi:hypothetical protein
MGSDLIGYMVLAPAKITKEMVAKAKLYLGGLNKEAQEEFARLAVTKDAEWSVDMVKGKKLQRLFESIDFDNFYNEDVFEALRELKDLEVDKVVDTAAEFLNIPDSRDSVSRYISKRTKCIFSGDFSWGDEPDGGGYSILKNIHKYGLDKLWRIR